MVFLDIQMPGLDGLDLARLLTGFARPPLVVFVTAHEDFAVQAFDLEAVDYVLKPVRRERLAEAVRRAADLQRHHRPASPCTNPTPTTWPWSWAASPASSPVDDITHVEAQGDYARLHTGQGSSRLVRVPLSTLEDRWRCARLRPHPPPPPGRPAPHRRAPAGRGHRQRCPGRRRGAPGQPPPRPRAAGPADAEALTVPHSPADRRVAVTGPPRRALPHARPRPRGRDPRTPGAYRPRTEIAEQTTLGHTYVRSSDAQPAARRADRAAPCWRCWSARCRCVFAALPRRRPPGVGRCSASALYAPLVLLARWYVRRAERNERDFVRLVEDR
ncbi:hypothetical protein SGLAM104S_01721 [Streptomyces glaucescens]